MRCPFCSCDNSQVKDSRPTEDGAAIRRRRQCEECGARFTTFERVQMRDIIVVKKDGRRQPFDRHKLTRSVTLACRKRPITADQIELLVSSIQHKIETSGENEVEAIRLGQMTMEGLRTLDSVAYIRFASVYKDFTEARDFEDFARSVIEAARE
ncbi:MAG: transcriptional regulator NrdR [Zymomonas mobilis subsp. pomaceae]|uniref:Transcriptional repressor NrdR n=1 Tax=Zymomonas mobilis subsp. pomaceae (strain ATCC 29192 / DSM 22645 / JCM 10191 / CCUG 17912 / NBRC 13757 / NCIMB 11200 / NRRL B-4491 / Barker I) TaxID=579138 RepID=F8ETJ5_ZYMMT|nr:transcriptional regulator NrdR [Zymomonas mobilis]AEI37005.1 ATP-cone domain protein [Zymomonas mobilis subsp. pomaceae ATCC 29192]MDX5948377.1 transcriptional regulator NrdR [Zymomonas mobilis subsp. pomaceae]GEB89633.1 transcriptional repressor NrdR [Zymomonas mobilis subsp. pomaceae]